MERIERSAVGGRGVDGVLMSKDGLTAFLLLVPIISKPAPAGDSWPTNDAPVSHVQREVWPGGGHIPLKEWVDAVLATGYDGWWSPELHSPKHWEMDPWRVAFNLRETLELMLL